MIGCWIHMKILVSKTNALLYLYYQQPALIVNELKLGGKQVGGVGFFAR